MALTRRALKAMGIEDEKVDEIISMHSETVNGLKDDIERHKADADRYKADADKLSKVQKELDDLKAAGDGGLSVLQDKYNTLEKDHKKLAKEYDQYKSDQAAKETRNTKEKAYRAALKEMNISEKRMDTVVKAAHADGVIDRLELDDNGAIKDADKLKESIKTDWSDFIVTTTTQGAQIAHPPTMVAGNKHTMTIEDIDKIKDTGERQRAMAQNLDLYGIK